MPEHTSFLSYLIAMFPALGENMHNFGRSFLGQKPVDAHGAEPLAASLLVVLLLTALALKVKKDIANYEQSVIPDDKLTLRTFFEIFIGYFYGMMKDMMGPTRAKKFFPVVGTAARSRATCRRRRAGTSRPAARSSSCSPSRITGSRSRASRPSSTSPAPGWAWRCCRSTSSSSRSRSRRPSSSGRSR
jgi:hypothetical protein